MNIGGYLKSIVPGLITIGYAVQAAASDGKITHTEAAALGSLALTTVAAWLVPNTPKPAAVVDQPVAGSVNKNAAAAVTTVNPGGTPAGNFNSLSEPNTVDNLPLIPPDTTP